MNDNKNFTGLGKALDIDYEQAEIVRDISTDLVEVSTDAILPHKSDIAMNDEEYLREQTKKFIDIGAEIMEGLKNEMKVGSSPRMFEAFAKVQDSIVATISELRELNKNAASIKIAKDKKEVQIGTLNVQNNNTLNSMKMSSSDLNKMLKVAESESQLNLIDAKFDLSREKLI